jgi:hypothetical protein
MPSSQSLQAHIVYWVYRGFKKRYQNGPKFGQYLRLNLIHVGWMKESAMAMYTVGCINKTNTHQSSGGLSQVLALTWNPSLH